MSTLRSLSATLALVALTGGSLLAAPLPFAASLAAAPANAPRDLSSALLWSLLASLPVAVGITIRKDTATLANKFVTRAQAAAPDYKDGVAGAGGDWENNTKASEPNYEQGVQLAITRKAFGRGVSGSASKYQTNAVNLGAPRYGPGIANAKQAWQAGVEPAFNVLKSLTLPPKGPRRSPQNQQRANAVALALGAMKEAK